MAFVSRGAANFLKRIFWHNCARPWYVYVETFIPAFAKVVFLASLLDAEDVMRMHAANLAAGRGSGPHRRKRHFTKVRLSAKETPTQRIFRQGLRSLLIITAPLEAIGFAWMMYSLANQFWWDWASMIEQSDFCDQPIESGPLSRSRGEGQIGILSSGDATPLPTLDQNRAGWNTTGFGVELPEGRMKCAFALTITGAGGPLNGVHVRLRVVHSLGGLTIEGEKMNIAARQKVDLIVFGDFFVFAGGGGAVAWELVGPSVPAGVFCHQGNFNIQRTG